jgi:hypothetical protein
MLVLFTGISLLFSVGAYIYLGKLNNIIFTLFLLTVNFYDGKLAGNAPALVVRTTTGKDHPQSWKIPKYIAAVKL